MKIENKVYSEERSLYGIEDAVIENCVFEGEPDGESPIKETRNVTVLNSKINLRYPFWHCTNLIVKDSEMNDNSRAAYWYSNNGLFDRIKLNSVKFLRECENVQIFNSSIDSIEFAWRSKELYIENTTITNSVYPFFEVYNLHLKNVKAQGKYSFQYDEGVLIEDSYLDTKDAFWHSKNVTVKNSTIKGEYLAWYAKNITFINCTIIGTQPFVNSENIVMKNCKLEGCDLAFENSTFDVDCPGESLISIKNPKKGTIICKSVGERIINEFKYPGKVTIIENK